MSLRSAKLPAPHRVRIVIATLAAGLGADAAAAVEVDIAADEQCFTIHGQRPGDTLGHRLGVVVADLDGDGQFDLVVAAYLADGPGAALPDAGEVYVFYGPILPGPPLSTAAAGLTITGADPGDELGYAIAVADVSGDGRPDLVASARGGDGPGNLISRAGEAVVFLGPLATGPPLSASAADLVVHGADPEDELQAIAVGDVGGGAGPDLILSAPGGDGPAESRTQAGDSYVLFGPLLAGPPRALPTAADLVLYGENSGDSMGVAIGSADLDDDAQADLVVASGRAEGRGSDAGEAHVFFGPLAAGVIDLAAAPPPHLVVYGTEAGDQIGDAIATGDLDGDGIADLVQGGNHADGNGNGRPSCGEVHVLDGKPALAPGSVDLPADAVVYGAASGDEVHTPILPGDLTGDCLPDLMAGGVAGGFGGMRPRAGQAYVIAGPLAGVRDLASPPPPELTIYGAEAGDELGAALAAGELTGDGIPDLVASAPFADGPLNGLPDAGEVYIVCGAVSAPVPPELGLAGAPLLLARDGNDILYSWEDLGGAPIVYNVYEGILRQVDTHVALACAIGGAATGPDRREAVLTPAAGSRYYLMSASNCAAEGASGGDPARSSCAP